MRSIYSENKTTLTKLPHSFVALTLGMNISVHFKFYFIFKQRYFRSKLSMPWMSHCNIFTEKKNKSPFRRFHRKRQEIKNRKGRRTEVNLKQRRSKDSDSLIYACLDAQHLESSGWRMPWVLSWSEAQHDSVSKPTHNHTKVDELHDYELFEKMNQ